MANFCLCKNKNIKFNIIFTENSFVKYVFDID